jgi:hypothetical protein
MPTYASVYIVGTAVIIYIVCSVTCMINVLVIQLYFQPLGGGIPPF